MIQRDKDDRQDRDERRRNKTQERIIDDVPRRRRLKPYKREQTDYDDYLQDEALENDWFDQNI